MIHLQVFLKENPGLKFEKNCKIQNNSSRMGIQLVKPKSNHSFSKVAKYSEKLTSLTPLIRKPTCP